MKNINLDLINYRRKKAEDTLKDAKIMFNRVSLFTTVNRIYYAVFYEVSALLLTKGLSSSKHSGVRALFNQEFVKPGVVREKYADFYNRMFGSRQEADYGDFVEFDEGKVRQWLCEAEDFIKEIEKIISEIVERNK